jgi:hypothetical protein
VRPVDHTPTTVIPRAPSDTGPLPALAGGLDRQRQKTAVFCRCPCAPCPAWRRAAAAALVLAWVTLGLWAYALVRIGLLFWEWR